jgi:hypothetical protein
MTSLRKDSRDLIRNARAGRPSPTDGAKSRVRTAILAKVGAAALATKSAAAAGGAVSTTATATAGSGLFVKLAAVILVFGAVLTAGFVATPHRAPPPAGNRDQPNENRVTNPTPLPPTTVSPSLVPSGSPAPLVTVLSPTAHEASRIPRPIAVPTHGSSAPSRSTVPSHDPNLRARHTILVANGREGANSADASAATPSERTEQSAGAVEANTSDSTRSSERAAASSPKGQSNRALTEEVSLLREAHTARVLGRPAEALKSLDTYALRFGAGMLATEALGERVLALCALGRRTEARGIAANLNAQSGPLAALVSHSCVAEANEEHRP